MNLTRSCIMICIFDTLVALLAGLAIFPAVAHFDPELLHSSQGVVLMFVILTQVFESLGIIGRIISFAFFLMVSIAAVTSVVSLLEVVTQFTLQSFRINRKKAAMAIMALCFLVSIPIGISLGHVAILGESGPALFGLDMLTFFDEVTNTVLMPVAALLACLTIGWILKPEQAIREMEQSGSGMPVFMKKSYAVMIRYVTPLLILAVEIGGILSELQRGNYAVIAAAVLLILICVLLYVFFLKHRETGTNKDELAL